MIHSEEEANLTIQPWVTFCMTTYRRPTFLRDQLNSLLQQTFPHFLIIISDNDIEASGEKIVKEINDPRIFYECNGENLGMVKSFNKSLSKAKTEFIVMITDDDPVYPEMLQTLYDLSIKYPGYGMYFGGHDRYYFVAKMAQTSKARVGKNSQLANLDLGTIRQFSRSNFPLSYLEGDFGGGILWSTGIVKREIALKIGGAADYGTPNMMDCAFVFLAGSEQGAVFVNTSLGYQAIHSDNYSYDDANFKNFSKGISGFYEWVKTRLPNDTYTASLDKKIKKFVAGISVTFFIFVTKNIRRAGIENNSFNKCLEESFSIPFMRKWKIKYWIAVNLPFLFPILVSLKTKLFK
jgi:glycosyltransferase involved in cell wall biosynthesis